MKMAVPAISFLVAYFNFSPYIWKQLQLLILEVSGLLLALNCVYLRQGLGPMHRSIEPKRVSIYPFCSQLCLPFVYSLVKFVHYC